MGKLISLVFLFLGVFAISQVVFPLMSFKIWEFNQIFYSNTTLLSPQPDKKSEVLGVSIKNEDNFPMIVSNTTRDTPPTFSQFRLEISSININSEVFVDSNDLSKGLAHLPGSALPGEKGNSFISGHSAIPVFIGSKADAIFANLPKIKKGEKITVETNGVVFNYLVDSIKIIDPKDLSVIAPLDNQGRYITLMTCVPPGFNTKRLIVIGKMI